MLLRQSVKGWGTDVTKTVKGWGTDVTKTVKGWGTDVTKTECERLGYRCY